MRRTQERRGLIWLGWGVKYQIAGPVHTTNNRAELTLDNERVELTMRKRLLSMLVYAFPRRPVIQLPAEKPDLRRNTLHHPSPHGRLARLTITRWSTLRPIYPAALDAVQGLQTHLLQQQGGRARAHAHPLRPIRPVQQPPRPLLTSQDQTRTY